MGTLEDAVQAYRQSLASSGDPLLRLLGDRGHVDGESVVFTAAGLAAFAPFLALGGATPTLRMGRVAVNRALRQASKADSDAYAALLS